MPNTKAISETAEVATFIDKEDAPFELPPEEPLPEPLLEFLPRREALRCADKVSNSEKAWLMSVVCI